MSFVHCSPLFQPLEPLPIMSPTIMRNGKRQGSTDSQSATTAKSTTNSTRQSTRGKGKKSATPRASHPLANTALTLPVDDNAPVSGPSGSHIVESPQVSNGVLSSGLQYIITSTTSCPENSVDSQSQGFLTFTTESQPMSDLSSSQQMNR